MVLISIPPQSTGGRSKKDILGLLLPVRRLAGYGFGHTKKGSFVSMCELLKENFDLLVLFNGIIIVSLVISAFASVARAKDLNWDFSFLLKPYANFEFFNFKIYGIFSVILIAMLVLLVSAIVLAPHLLKYCI